MPSPRPVLACLALSLLLLATARPAPAETIELKTGTTMQGEIVETTADAIVLEVDGARLTIKMSDIAPYQQYRLRVKQLADGDAPGHFALGEFCRASGLYSQARTEYDKALAIDAALGDKIRPALEALATAEADAWLGRGKAAIQEGRLEDALKHLQVLTSRFPDTAQAADAKTLMAEATQSLRQRNEEKERQLKALADQRAGKGRGEEELTARFQTALRLVEEGKLANAEGLDHEGATKTSRAQKAFEKAVAAFREAREIVAEILKTSKDVDLLAAAKEKAPELDRWLVIGYENLGHLWAVEFNFREALKWLNKALAIDPNDKFALELKLKMAEQHIGRNARGYLPPETDTNGPIR